MFPGLPIHPRRDAPTLWSPVETIVSVVQEWNMIFAPNPMMLANVVLTTSVANYIMLNYYRIVRTDDLVAGNNV